MSHTRSYFQIQFPLLLLYVLGAPNRPEEPGTKDGTCEWGCDGPVHP